MTVTRAFSGTTDTVVAGDDKNMLRFTGSADCVLSVTAAATLGAGFDCGIENAGTANAKLTIDPNGSEKVNGASTLDLYPGDMGLLIDDNTGGAEFRFEPCSTSRSLIFSSVSLPNATFKRVFGSNLAIGDTDLYTCPTGKRALFIANMIYNPSGGSVTWFAEIKISGTYYRLGSSSTTSTLSQSNNNTAGPIILEAGEILAINCVTTAGLNAQFIVIEFDASAALKTAKLVNLSTGDNTLYTCPAGKSAMIWSPLGNPSNVTVVATGFLHFCADSGGTRTTKYFAVASGGSSATTNQISAANSAGASTHQTTSSAAEFAAGDFLVINVDTGNAAQIAWINLLEI